MLCQNTSTPTYVSKSTPKHTAYETTELHSALKLLISGMMNNREVLSPAGLHVHC